MKAQIKLLIAGGRDYADYNRVKSELYGLLRNEDIDSITIISGACDSETGVLTFTRPDGKKIYGMDGLGEKYAHERGIKVDYHPANWKQYGKSAGPIRNEDMAYECTRALIAHDGKSKGTGNMIKMLVKYSKPYDTINY